MADYEGMDASALEELLEKATSYEERSAIRRTLRNLKGSKAKKTVGSSQYHRMGTVAPKSVSIPNSVTGNMLPTKVNVTHNKVEHGSQITSSYLKGGKDTPYGNSRKKSTDQFSNKGTSPRLSPRGSVSSYTSVTPEPKDLAEPEKAPEVVKAESVQEAQSPEPPRDMTPEPVREPTPEPEREPTPSPEPIREPTPEPTPEPSPEPEREPTPELIREPTPELIREPTPELIRELTPEPSPEPEREPSPEPEEDDKPADSAEEQTDDDDESPDQQDDQSDEDAEYTEETSERAGNGRSSYDPTKVGIKTSLPIEVLAKKEEGIDGDFRLKLRKAEASKIDTTKAFPQAKPKGDQVDFRNVLRKAPGPERKRIRTGAAAQSDFRGSLRGKPISPKPKRGEQQEVEQQDVEQEASEPEQEVEAELDPEPVEEESEQVEPEPEQDDEPEESNVDEVDAVVAPVVEVKPVVVETKPTAADPDSYEVRMAERRRRRAERSKEHVENMTSEPTADSVPVENGTAAEGGLEDSYEARKEARRKAKEGRDGKEVSDDKPRMSYRERKEIEARNQMKNARDSRNKWNSREEESGEKAEAKGANFKKKDSATQQLLAWCQHKTKYYDNVEVKDFRRSWSDGMAFCAILHSFLPDKIPFEDLSPADPRNNFTVAFEAAKDAGIPEMLDVEDMLAVRVPDSKSIMTFLVTIYQHFN